METRSTPAGASRCAGRDHGSRDSPRMRLHSLLAAETAGQGGLQGSSAGVGSRPSWCGVFQQTARCGSSKTGYMDLLIVYCAEICVKL